MKHSIASTLFLLAACSIVTPRASYGDGAAPEGDNGALDKLKESVPTGGFKPPGFPEQGSPENTTSLGGSPAGTLGSDLPQADKSNPEAPIKDKEVPQTGLDVNEGARPKPEVNPAAVPAAAPTTTEPDRVTPPRPNHPSEPTYSADLARRVDEQATKTTNITNDDEADDAELLVKALSFCAEKTPDPNVTAVFTAHLNRIKAMVDAFRNK